MEVERIELLKNSRNAFGCKIVRKEPKSRIFKVLPFEINFFD